jgi:hypothetical protein
LECRTTRKNGHEILEMESERVEEWKGREIGAEGESSDSERERRKVTVQE